MVDLLRLGLSAGILASLAWGGMEYVRDNQQTPAQVHTPLNNNFIIHKPEGKHQPLSHYRAIIERPLFYADRRLPLVEKRIAQSTPVKTEKPTTLPRIKLNAIIFAQGQASALIYLPDSREYRQIKVGGMLDGWRIQHMGETDITLTAKQQQHTIKLHDFGQAPAYPTREPNAQERRQPTKPRQPPPKSNLGGPIGFVPATSGGKPKFKNPANNAGP